MRTGTTEVTVELDPDDLLQWLADEGEKLNTAAVTYTWTPCHWELTEIALFEAPARVRVVMGLRDQEEGS